MPLVTTNLALLGYDPDEDLTDLDLQDATTLTIRLAGEYERSPLAGADTAATHLTLAAASLNVADSIRDALPYIANVNIAVALRDLAAARQALATLRPNCRPGWLRATGGLACSGVAYAPPSPSGARAE